MTLPDDVEELALQALECDDDERDRRLLELFATYPRHEAALRAWLGAAGVKVPGAAPDDQADATAGAAPGPRDEADETADPPRRIGRYRIERVLGRGGFGTVYLGRRDGTGPLVAVKVLNPGMDSRDIRRRFAAEREALHRVDHQGIARLVDDGETAAGRPFFVMEHIDGPPLALYCRRENLPRRTRIELFLQVLDAVAHAHGHALIHRDLSSNNVLVATNGDGQAVQPKIIDFGVAKSVAVPLQEGATLTFQGTMMGTPEFMSPEQAQGRVDAIDTRTDIYSLGVQLYELLTDQMPIPGVVLRSQGIAGMADIIRRHEPPRPSQVAPPKQQAALRGDLDWITLKALAKDKEQRYATASEFAADLRRHLGHEPVTAGKPGTWYLLRKFARRNRGQVAFACAMLTLLLAALALSVWQWRAAARARADLQLAHDELSARADAGFRLLAGEELLLEATATVASLDPAWPERAAAMRAWLRDFAAPLELELPKLQRKLEELRAERRRQPGGRFRDPADAHLLRAIERLDAELTRFCGPGGLAQAVRHRLQFAESVVQPALARDRAAWEATATAVESRDGYRLAAQPGLVPLGRDPVSGLYEFLDLHSHPDDAPVPQRDPVTGRLQTARDAGVVFVLLSPGALRLGAQPFEPGLPQYDPRARPDEQGGQTVQLTEFLIARTELTQAQWARLQGQDAPDEPALPAVAIDHQRAVAVLAAHGMALPTEAQWEYACRAGTDLPWWSGREPAAAARVGVFGGSPRQVALLAPNPFGLYDVHGNVAEWCADWMFEDYRKGTVRNGDGRHLPPPPPVRLPELRAVRGGSAAMDIVDSRCTARGARDPAARESDLGVRPVRLVLRR